MSARARLTLAVALAVALGSSALAPLYVDLGWVLRVLGAVLAVTGAALAARRLRVPAPGQPLVQLVALAWYTALVFAPGTLYGGWLPTPGSLDAGRALAATGWADVAALSAPVPTNAGLVLLAVLGVGGLTVVVDVLAVLLASPAVAGLPLLLLFVLPSTVRPGGVGGLAFGLGAAGWLTLLLVDGRDRIQRWGDRPVLTGDIQTGGAGEGAVGRVGRRIGAAALGVALIIPAVLPGLDSRLFNSGQGSGGGSGRSARQSTTYNPITTLRGQLNQPEPTEVLRYTTTDPQPDYLRLTTLDTFDGTSWSASPLLGDPEQDAVRNGIDLPPTVDPVGTTTIRDRILITALATRWLPVPALPTGVALDGPWVWDRTAETVFSAADDTRDLRQPYEVTAARVAVGPGSLGSTGSRPPSIARYAEPIALTPYVADEVRRVTNGATTDFAKVLALQQYFLDSTRFAYSTNADAPRLATGDSLEEFLRNGRGFCEQYASAMAAMVRSLGLPARVAVGFTTGVKSDSGAYVVTTSDAHAWPEVWFGGTGWLRFEPTPRSGVTVVPAYAQRQAVVAPGVGGDLPVNPAPTRSAAPGGKDLDRLDPRGQGSQPAALPAESRPDRAWTLSARQSALVLLLLCLPLPAVLAGVRRRRRLHHATARSAWAQLTDDATDLGHRWGPAESPRAAATRLQAAYGLDPVAVSALQRVVLGVEQARYARPPAARPPGSGEALPGLSGDVLTVRGGLRRGAGRVQRCRAVLLPPATVHWLGAGVGGRLADLLDGTDDAVSRLGRLGRRGSGDRAGVSPR